jgi:hypothetical protein
VSVSVAAFGQAALASFSTSSSASATYTSATLSAPTGLSVIRAICSVGLSDSAQVSWSQPSNNKASGYEIQRSTVSGGPYTTIGTVSGASTTTYTDTGLAFATTYYYVVKSTKNNWKSSPTSQVSVTTRTPLCL